MHKNNLLLNENYYNLSEDILHEYVKYTLFPKFEDLFEDHPDSKEILNAVKELMEVSEMDEDEIVRSRSKVLRILGKIFRAILDVDFVLALPFIILITPIVGIVINRYFRYLTDKKMVKSDIIYAKKIVRAMKRRVTEERNSSKRKIVEKKIDKLEAILEKIEIEGR